MPERRYIQCVETVCALFICLSSPPKTFLEKTKQMFVRNYSGMPLEKITSTVGLNGMTLFIKTVKKDRKFDEYKLNKLIQYFPGIVNQNYLFCTHTKCAVRL